MSNDELLIQQHSKKLRLFFLILILMSLISACHPPWYKPWFKGVSYMHEKEYDQAVVQFNQALEIGPDRARLYYERGNAYFAKQEYCKALTDFNKALRLYPGPPKPSPNWYPEYAETLFKRAICLGVFKQWDKALIDAQKFRKIKPQNKAGILLEKTIHMHLSPRP